MKNNNVDVKGVPFLKFRGKEREGIIGMIERGDYNVEATLPRLLGLEEPKSEKRERPVEDHKKLGFGGIMERMETNTTVIPRKKKRKKKTTTADA